MILLTIGYGQVTAAIQTKKAKTTAKRMRRRSAFDARGHLFMSELQEPTGTGTGTRLVCRSLSWHGDRTGLCRPEGRAGLDRRIAVGVHCQAC